MQSSYVEDFETETQAELFQLIEKLKNDKIDEKLIARLEILYDSLLNQDFSWIYNNLDFIYNPTSFLDNARSTYSKKISIIGFFELVRNILVLLPVLFTWLALSQASNAYRSLIENNHSLVDFPFLYLWEMNFNGVLEPFWGLSLKFSDVAKMDAGLIVGVVILTFFVIIFGQLRTENSERNAVELASELSDVLWKIKKFVSVKEQKYLDSSEKRSLAILESLNTFVFSFENKRNDLENIIDLEKQRIFNFSEQREKEYEKLHQTSIDFQLTTNLYKQTAENMQSILEKINLSISNLSEEILSINNNQNHTIELLNKNYSQVDKLNQTIEVIENNQKEYVQNLVKSANNFIQESTSITLAIKNLNTALRAFSSDQSDFRELMLNQNNQIEIWESNISSSINKIEVTIKPLEQFQKAITQSSDKFGGVADKLNNFGNVFTQATNSSQSLSQTIHTLGEQIKSIHLEFQKMDRFLEELSKYLPSTSTYMSQIPQSINGLLTSLNSSNTNIKNLHNSNVNIAKQTDLYIEEIKSIREIIQNYNSEFRKDSQKQGNILGKFFGN